MAQAAAVFAENIRRWRIQRREPLKAMALALGVSESTVSAWERGVRSPSGVHLDAISDYVGIPIRCLFCEDLAQCAQRKETCC